MKIQLIALLIMSIIATACNAGSANVDNRTAQSVATTSYPQFNADSAYNFVAAQVDFGPRVPGTSAHKNCAQWIVSQLKQFNADTIIEQQATLKAFNGDRLPIINIFAQYNPNATKRVLLLAHWDTRPWADAETDPAKHKMPIPGANDGGSGVGVLLEIARNLSLKAPAVGVDLLFTDAEDYGNTGGDDNSWCLGTQYWVKNMPYDASNRPMYGILLDIVGGLDARFYREGFSDYLAPNIVNKVWATANAVGYGNIFVNTQRGAVTDDHFHINAAGIPCIDIIECANPATGSFPSTWHTLNDNMKSIDRNSLKAVGQTVINTIYNEK